MTPGNVVMFTLLMAGFIGLFFRWFTLQSQLSWRFLEDWGHAFFVPVIAGYLVWQRREQILAARPRVFWPGIIPVLTGILGYYTLSIGPIIGVHMGQGLFVVLTLWGGCLLLLGPEVTRWLMLPIAYLLFMITVSEAIMLRITWPLQLLASEGAYVLLGLVGMVFGFSVSVDGNILNVVSSDGVMHALNVAEACSGMRMVVAFVALAAAIALLASREWWQRLALLMLSVPVALLMNIIRVAVLGLATLGNSDLAQGQAHTLIGTLLLIPGLALFLGIVWVLGRITPAPETQAKPKRSAETPSPLRLIHPASFVLLVILSGSAMGMGWAINTYKYHLTKLPIYASDNRKVATIPTETESWIKVGQDKIVAAEILEVLGTSNYVSRTYMQKEPGPDGIRHVVELHVAYYTNQIDTVPHVPERCFVGGGMTQVSASQTYPLNLDQSRWILDPTMDVDPVYTARTSAKWSDTRGKRVRLPRGIEHVRLRASAYDQPGSGKVFSGYFFVANGTVASSAKDVRFLAFNLENDYAYYMKVQFTSISVSSPEQLAEVASSLLSELLPDLMLCVPDWVEVEAGRYPPGNFAANDPPREN